MSTREGLKVVTDEQVRSWYAEGKRLSTAHRSIGRKHADPEYLEELLAEPLHVRLVVDRLTDERGGELPANVLDSLPFFSLCHGLFLPLSGLAPERIAQLFGIQAPPPPLAAAREELLRKFVAKHLGLTLDQKLACILGDPFFGRPATLRRDSMIRLLASCGLRSRRELLDRLPIVGEVAALYAESRRDLHQGPPLTAAEVLETLRLVPELGRNRQFQVLRSILERMGKLEAYFLAKLILRSAGFGFDYQGPLLARILAAPYDADPGQVAHAIALTSAFHVARVLHEGGAAALQRIHVQPLVPIRPALAATGSDAALKKLPAWVERKYDGIRLMLHKSTDARGSVLCGAYTRNRHDWLELVRGLDAEIRMLPCKSAIVDGELHGTIVDLDGLRPANVYDVHTTLQGTRVPPAALRFAAFDLVYLDGQDLTGLPLRERRRRLANLLAPLVALPLPVPITLSEGQLAQNQDDVNRLYHHFRAQGYEGIIAKDLEGPYLMGERDPTWVKRKPELTLDLVLLGAVLAVTTKENVGQFGSYVIGARGARGELVDVGDVAGIDRAREAGLRAEILEQGLLTGGRFERPSASGVRPGFWLRPQIVVTVRFEGVVRDNVTKKLSLRDLKLVAIRPDKQAGEADSVEDIEAAFLRARVG